MVVKWKCHFVLLSKRKAWLGSWSKSDRNWVWIYIDLPCTYMKKWPGKEPCQEAMKHGKFESKERGMTFLAPLPKDSVLYWDVNQTRSYSSSLRVWHSGRTDSIYRMNKWRQEGRSKGRKEAWPICYRSRGKIIGIDQRPEAMESWRGLNGGEPFFFTKVKKSLTTWELWFLFVVAQVGVQLERMDLFDWIGYS